MAYVFQLHVIEPNRRLIIEHEVIEELGVSISREGQREPIIIYQHGLSFRIVDGEKRWRAIKRMGWTTILVETQD